MAGLKINEGRPHELTNKINGAVIYLVCVFYHVHVIYLFINGAKYIYHVRAKCDLMVEHINYCSSLAAEMCMRPVIEYQRYGRRAPIMQSGNFSPKATRFN